MEILENIMTDLATLADARAWAAMQLRARNAEHGFRRARQKELEEFTARMLRREIGRRKRRVLAK